MNERWKPVVGYEGIYEVSDLGRVRSLDRVASAGYVLRGRILKQNYCGNLGEYRVIGLSRGGVKSRFLIHRLVLAAFVGPCPEGMEGCHNNGVASDNRLENLRWDTHAANQLQCIDDGTTLTGERNPGAKLKVRGVREVIRLRGLGCTYDKIASQVGISLTQVQRIVRKENWAHVQ